MFIKALTILFLVAGILGGSGYFIYELYDKEKKLDIVEQAAVPTPTPAPTPHPALAAFDSLKPVLAQNTVEARDAIANHLSTYPDSPKTAEARTALGQIARADPQHVIADPAVKPVQPVRALQGGGGRKRHAGGALGGAAREPARRGRSSQPRALKARLF